jgi:hypothetical protein
VCVMAVGSEPYVCRAEKVARSINPNRKWRWLVPFVFAAQVWFKMAVLDPRLERDGWEGDQYGPFDPEFAAAEKARRLRAKVSLPPPPPLPPFFKNNLSNNPGVGGRG